MKHNLLRFSLPGLVLLLGGGIAVSAALGEESKAPVASAPARAAVVEKTGTWDFDNATVKAALMAFSGSNETGTVASAEDNGLVLTVVANGATFRDNGNNVQVRRGAEFRVPVATSEDIVTIKGFPGYSYYSINGGEEIKNDNNNPVTTYKAKSSDVARGYVSVVSTNDNNYYYALSVEQMKPRQLLTLDNATASATFDLSEGVEKPAVTFVEEDYFLTSKVVCGSAIALEGKDNKSLGMTWFNPATKQSGAAEEGSVKFLVQPKFGLNFTPTKVSFKSTRFGTDGGYINVAWLNSDGSTVSLATEQKPPRDNATPNVGEYTYNVTGAKACDGACGIVIYVYDLANNKRIGFKDVVIEGVMNGTEVEVPVLESFKVNGESYVVEDIFEAEGDTYVASVALASTATIISAQNPLTDVVASKGEVGTIVYDGDADKCKVTIPVTLNDVTINYILNVIRKPILTLSYFNTDGTAMGTQQIEQDQPIGEFGVDYTTAKADEGYKVRGWFLAPTGGKKAKTDDIVVDNMSLYAYATEIETESLSKKYNFNLADQWFYPEDHEAFSTTAGYWHDATHGWAFKNGDKIELLVGPKASISIALCRYGYGSKIVATDAAGKEIASVDGKSTQDIDGEIVAFNYEGNGGVITLSIESTGEMYIHSVKIVNNTEVTYINDGQWFYVKADDAQSLIDVIEAVSAHNASRDAERAFVFIPDGTYDLRETVLTNISGHNISIIGQSREGILIVNRPHYTTEGIGTTATLMNTGTNLYMQDLVIQNALDYYGAQDKGLAGGRAVAFWDKGINTVCKNVTLLSYQDTYYSNNIDGQYYWETSEVHGTVDFLCGEGAMFMQDCRLVVEKRKQDGSGGCTLTAPSTKAGNRYGYVFRDCFIENYAHDYNLGRAWSNEPRAAFINTTVNDDKMVSSRWTANGMNVAAKEFVEYNTMDTNGNVVNPSSNVIKFIKGSNVNEMETILTADQAAEFTVEKVFTDWAPATLAKQVAAPAGSYASGKITWPAVDGAMAYAIFKDGVLLAIVNGTSYDLAAANADADYTMCALNSMGGLSAVAPVTGLSGIDMIENAADVVSTVLYNVQGVKVDSSYKGVVVKVDTLSDGTTVSSKVINR